MTKAERTALAVATAKRTLVAFFFGFVMSAVFAVAIGARFEPLIKLERESVDFGLKLATVFFDQSASGVPERASPIVMVDIDAEACEMLASANRCNFDRIVQPEVVAAVVETVETIKPKVAVLDMLVPPEAGAALLQTMNEEGPPLLTAMELTELNRSAIEGEQGYLLSKSLCGATTCGRLEYLPAFAMIQDGKARYYRTEVEVRLLETLDGAPRATRRFPTIAHRAAEIADPDELYNDGNPQPQIGYTIPSFALHPGNTFVDPATHPANSVTDEGDARERFGRLRTAYDDNSEYFKLSTIKETPDAPVEVGGLPPDAVLIIGSSAAAGGDRHNTPLGPMGGMEVVANAIRSFQLAAPEQVPSPAEAFETKIEAVVKALFIIAIVEVFLAYFIMRREKASAAGRPVVGEGAFWDRWSLPISFTMLLAFVGEFLLTMWEIITQLNEDAGRAGAVDVIWPVVGVTFSALIGFSGEVVGKIDWLVDKAFALLRGLFARLQPSDASPEEGQ